MTSTTANETLILKTDVLGRVYMPKERREAILDAFERSSMSGQAFAAHVGVKYPTLATWLQRRRRKRGDDVGKESKKDRVPPIALLEAFVDSKPPASPGMGTLQVETAQGLKLRIGSTDDVTLAAELLRALSGGSSC